MIGVNPYTTMSKEAEAQIAVEILKFLKNGGLYNGFKPVLWSVVEATALADAEVEYADHKSNTIFTKFPAHTHENLENVNLLFGLPHLGLCLAIEALAINSNYEYSLVEVTKDSQKEIVILAKNLINSVIDSCDIKDFKIIESFPGSEFKNMKCFHPFKEHGYDFEIPLLEGDFVTLEQGTGIVHIAPSHGPDDFNLGLKNNIKAEKTWKNISTNLIKKFEGIHINADAKIIIEELKKAKNF